MKMRKILSLGIIGIIILTGLGAMATPQEEHILQSSELIPVSQPMLMQENNYFITITMDDTDTYLMKPNQPLLPSYVHTFTFPFGTRIHSVDVTPKGTYEKHLSNKITPSPVPVIAGIGYKNREPETMVTYSDDPYPDTWYTYRVGTGIYNRERCVIVTVETYPIQYYPNEDKIIIADNLDVTVSYELPQNTLPTFDEQYHLIIIAPSEYSGALQSLVNHKISRGISTKLVTLSEIYGGTYFAVEGRDNPEQIKYFIKNAIENWGITSVLLVGGSKSMPTRETHIKVSNSDKEVFVSDLYYADIYNDTGGFSSWDTNANDVFAEYQWNGNTDELDLHPDVYLGRLACVDTTEVTTAVNKIITYETNKAYTQDWFTNIIGVGGDSFTDDAGDDSGVNEGEYVNEEVFSIMDGFIPNAIWASNGRLSGVSPTGVVEITDAFEQGAGFADFSGHGNTNIYATHPNNASWWIPTPTGGLFNYHVGDFENGDKLPIVITGACSVGKYNKNDNCFSWSFVANPNGGGIASCGATALGYAYVGKWVTYGLVEGVAINMFKAYRNGAITFGEMWVNALNDYIKGSLDAGDYKTIEEWQPFGDPTLAVAKESTKPNKPAAPTGPASGKINVEYTYNASTTDPDNDEIYYLFDWGDGTYSGWLGPYDSGDLAQATHMWTEKGSYEIRVKAKDEHGVQSDWSDPLPISMPKGRQSYNGVFFEFLQDHFPLFYSVLQQALSK